MKNFYLLISILIFSQLHYSFAQDDYLKWLQKEQEKYQKYIDEQDKKFLDFLRKEWKEVGLEKGLPSFNTPKPVEPPKFIEVEKKSEEIKVLPPSEPKKKTKLNGEKVPPEKVEKIPSDEKEQKPRAVESEKLSNALTLEFDFYGASLKCFYNDKIKIKLKGKLSKETIANFWEDLSSSNYKDILQQAISLKSQMHLNDWGYLILINNLAEKIYSDLPNEKILFIWFLLVKSGYLARVGYYEDRVTLLIATDNVLYETPYLFLKNHTSRFYRITLDEKSKIEIGKIYTYDGEYPTSTKVFDFYLRDYPLIEDKYESKTISFIYNKKEYVIPFEYNISAVKFFERYPKTEYPVYFSAGMSEKAKTSLLNNLKPYIKDKSEYEAVNFLLHFVQKATDYKTDFEQFGREKPLFPEESLFYKFSDCEDRSILFSFLVKKLTGLEVIGLKFPNHVAVAVKFNQNVEGDYINYKGSKYLICDPTYFGADAGICMPAFKNVEAKIIEW